MKSVQDFLADLLPASDDRPAAEHSTDEHPTSDEYPTARARAIRFIGVDRRKTSGRVRRHLLQQSFSEQTAERVIADLTKDGYIDDDRLARAVLRERSGRKAESARALQHRMQNLGIRPDAIRRALDECALSDEERIRDFLQSKQYEVLLNLSEFYEKDETYRHLYTGLLRACAGRGFSIETATRAINSLLRTIKDGHL
jgi:SOS response regulatory protein OraA/RecX